MKRGREDNMAPGGMKRPVRPPQQAAQGHRLTTNDALTYLREVKNRFQDKKEVYDTFLEIMKEFKAQRIDTSGVILRVKELFKGHKQLVLGFNTFLPKGYEIQLADVADMDSEPEDAGQGPPGGGQPKQPVEFDQAISYVNKIKTRFATDERVYKAFLEILNMYRKGNKSISQVYDEVAVLFKNHHDLLTEFTYFLPDSSPPAGGQHPLLARVGISAPWHPPGSRKGPYGAGGSNRIVMPGSGPRYPPGGYQVGYNKRKAARPEHGRAEEEMGGRSTHLERELQFFERVKQRLRNREAYQEFLKCLNLFATDVITKSELLALVGDVLVKHPDLLSGFHNFLGRCETMHSFEDDWRAITQAQRTTGREGGRGGKGQPKDRYFSKPISEVAAELNPDDRCTTSYVRVPSGFPRLSCSGRNQLHHEVLNDSWVSIISGSEDYSFKLMRKNQYEEALFRCEDDRFELDMYIESNASTIRKLQPLADAFGAMSPDDKVNYRLPEGYLGPVHFRAIERIYGDSQGPNVVDLLRKNPTVAIPVVLARLEQKDKEWRQNRLDMIPQWRKVFEQNYNKSLDHRSFYFKQADKKSLTPKSMLQEIKDAADKRRADKAQLRTFCVGCPVSVYLNPPDLSFDYPDSAVFDDVYQVVVYALEEMLPSETRGSIIKLWHDIVEPFFGREDRSYVRLHAVDDPEEVHEAPESSSEEAAPAGGRKEDGGDSAAGGGNGDAVMTDAGVTPEPGTTPEPDGDGLEALLAAGRAEMSEPDGDKGKEGGKEAEEGSEDSADSTEEEANRFYGVCKPVAGQPQTKAAAGAAAGGPCQKQHIMYGNESLYYFFRFHWHLYDRLLTAQRCAREKLQPQQYSAWAAAGEPQRTPERELSVAQREDAKALHSEFMGMVRAMLDGQLEASLFEDQVRQLLGTNSYVLFTLDKLITKMVKHLQTIASDEHTMRLVELHRYERARRQPLSDEIYRADASVILDESAGLFRFEYGEGSATAAAAAASAPEPPASSSSAASSSGRLQIQLLDVEKNDGQMLSLEPAFSAYIKSYLCSSAGLKQGKVFAQRCVSRPKGQAADEDPRLLAALRSAHILNGLEGKISCNSSKASYVLDTEDIFYRRRGAHGPASAAAEGRRLASWSAWYDKELAGQLGQAAGVAERTKEVLEVAPVVAELAGLAGAGHSGLAPTRVAYPPAAAAAYQRSVAAAAGVAPGQ